MLSIGEKLSHYKIISAIGAGGMGEVYLAEDTKLDRKVAIKVLNKEFSNDSDKLNRFIQEAKAASALNHPNILTVYEIGRSEGSEYIATEFIKGGTLRERMRGEPLKLGETLEIALQVAAALGAAHDAGIIHRDIKPENIMIRDDGLVKVLDFGLAKLTEKQPETASSEDETKAQFNTQPGLVMGTVAYMSPEQARGRKLDARSDIFSLGIVMYELFTGKRPFDGESHLDLISSILKDDPPSLRQISPTLPRQLERIVGKTLRKDRDNRYHHVRDLHIDIEDLRDELKFEAKLNQTVEPTVTGAALLTNPSDLRSTLTTGISKTRRFTLLHALMFVVAVAGIVGAAWYFRLIGSGPSAVAHGSYKISEIAVWNSAPGELFSRGSFSPDGKLIAFASTKSGSKNIWVTQTASTEAIQITNDAFANIDPVLSPKGDEIAFLSERGSVAGGKSTPGIWRVSALGGTPRLVGSISEGGAALRRWTTSGKIYYQAGDDLYAIDAASGTSQKITSLDLGSVSWITISADEKSIAYVTQNAGQWRLLFSDFAGTGATEVAKGAGDVQGVAWLPERDRFFYGAIVDGVSQVFVTDTRSGESRRITSSETDNSVTDAAPDGASVIITSAKEESNLWRVTLADSVESDVARDLNAKLWPTVSPDNGKIAFQSVKNLSEGNKLFQTAIVVKTAKIRDDSERPTLLAEHGYLPSWSPDGSLLAFMKVNSGTSDLFSVNPAGGGEKRLTTGVISPGYSVLPYNHQQANAFAWSPDSSRIAYVSEKNGAGNIWAVTRDGSDASMTANADPDLQYYCPMWSTDGKRLAFYFQRKNRNESGKPIRGLGIIDTETGATADIFESGKVIRLIGWTADGNGLIVAESSKEFSGLPPETVLRRVAIAGGTETEIARLKNAYYYNIFLSNDRKNIAFAARNENMDNLWVIPAAGGTARKLTSNNDSGLYYSRLAWLHDGSAVVFGKQTRFSLLSIITDIN